MNIAFVSSPGHRHVWLNDLGGNGLALSALGSVGHDACILERGG